MKRELSGILSEPDDQNESTSPGVVLKEDVAPPRSKNASRQTWWVAASALIALGIGYALGGSGQTNSPSSSSIATHEEKQPKNSIQWLVNDPQGQELRQIEIPVLSTADLKESWQEHLLSVDRERALMQEMRGHGLNMEHQRTLTPVRLKNGQRVIVPVDYFYEKPIQ